MDDVKNLVEKITNDSDAMDLLCEELLSNTTFVRELTEKISEAVEDGVTLIATKCSK